MSAQAVLAAARRAARKEPVVGACTSHTVVVVDHSGSMRTAAGKGMGPRHEAVINCLTENFVKPQLADGAGASGVAEDAGATAYDGGEHRRRRPMR